jgi:hypothetical protein
MKAGACDLPTRPWLHLGLGVGLVPLIPCASNGTLIEEVGGWYLLIEVSKCDCRITGVQNSVLMTGREHSGVWRGVDTELKEVRLLHNAVDPGCAAPRFCAFLRMRRSPGPGCHSGRLQATMRQRPGLREWNSHLQYSPTRALHRPP